MPATYDTGLVDVAGRPLTESGGISEAVPITYTRQRTMPDIVQATMPVTSEAAAAITAGTLDPYLKLYRTPEGGSLDDRQLVFYGSLWVDDMQGGGDGPDKVVATFRDQLALLEKRYTNGQYAVQDIGAILKDMVDTTNNDDGETGISTNVAWITASSTVDIDLRTNLPSIASMVEQFSTQLDGVEVWVEPIELSGGKICQLWIAPRRGQDRSKLSFGYGEKTAANCTQMQRVRNKALVENDVRGYADELTAAPATDAVSIGRLGRLVGYVSFTGETDQSVLDSRTIGRLRQRATLDDVAMYTATPGNDAPVLFDEFDVGDDVELHWRRELRTGDTLEWFATARVDTATIDLVNGRHENLTALSFVTGVTD